MPGFESPDRYGIYYMSFGIVYTHLIMAEVIRSSDSEWWLNSGFVERRSLRYNVARSQVRILPEVRYRNSLEGSHLVTTRARLARVDGVNNAPPVDTVSVPV